MADAKYIHDSEGRTMGVGQARHPLAQQTESAASNALNQSQDRALLNRAPNDPRPRHRRPHRPNSEQVCRNLPTARLPLSTVVVPPITVASPAGLAQATLKLGGQLTATDKCSANPGTVSPDGASISGGGASLSTNSSGASTAKLSSTLGSLTSSVSVDLNSGSPKVSIGSVGTYGSTQTSMETLPTGAVKVTYTCKSNDVSIERNGVEITGNISYTLEVIAQPTPPKRPWWQRAWDGLTDWVSSHWQDVLVGVGIAAIVVGGAIVIAGTGGAAAPALAPALAS